MGLSGALIDDDGRLLHLPRRWQPGDEVPAPLHVEPQGDLVAHRAGGDVERGLGAEPLGGVGQLTSELLHEITGEGVIYQQIGYLMRSGSPDSLDLMVAINYAVMAADLVIEGTTGRLVALRNGNYSNVPLGVTRQGVKRVDVDSLYDKEQYLPKIRHVDGKPMFLY